MPPTTTTPPNRSDLLDLARRLYREYHARCFWHCPRELIITDDLIPFVAKGLRAHGGRRGFILSGTLKAINGPHTAMGEARECR